MNRAPSVASGRVEFVGSGPGDPGLLTVRAREALVTAPLIVTDPDVPEAVLAVASPDAEIRPAVGQPADVAKDLVAAARDGRRVTRLISGDAVAAVGDREPQLVTHDGRTDPDAVAEPRVPAGVVGQRDLDHHRGGLAVVDHLLRQPDGRDLRRGEHVRRHRPQIQRLDRVAQCVRHRDPALHRCHGSEHQHPGAVTRGVHAPGAGPRHPVDGDEAAVAERHARLLQTETFGVGERPDR